uniref:Uncharacterized protein n=1 Tax=Anopheles atroparvus TaxID=41427 RepID=A0AAG5D7V2_ANOAO
NKNSHGRFQCKEYHTISFRLQNVLSRRKVLVVSQSVSSVVPQSIIDDFGGDNWGHQLVVSQGEAVGNNRSHQLVVSKTIVVVSQAVAVINDLCGDYWSNELVVSQAIGVVS